MEKEIIKGSRLEATSSDSPQIILSAVNRLIAAGKMWKDINCGLLTAQQLYYYSSPVRFVGLKKVAIRDNTFLSSLIGSPEMRQKTS